MYKFPIRIHPDEALNLAQPYHGETTTLSKALSTDPTFHNGVDVTCGNAANTWGKECIWPFPWPGTVYYSEVDSPMGATLHAHAQVDTVDPATGIEYSLVLIHLSWVPKTKTAEDSQVIVYNFGDVIGKIGNNGAVSPKPTPEQPFAGSHLHLGIGVKNPGELNPLMLDPLLYFNLTDPFRGPDAALAADIKTEIAVLQQQTDPTVKASFLKLIIAQVAKYLGFGDKI